MNRFVARSRTLLLAVVLAVAAVMCAVAPAHAASSVSATTKAPAASSARCVFNPATTCQSTDPTITLNIYYYGDSSSCVFVWDVNWGDGTSSSDLTVTDPPNGHVFLQNHTYKAVRTYAISVTGHVTPSDCTANPFTEHFTLLKKPAPPAKGKACVFNAPAGVVSIAGASIIGHVGWAYLANPATGIWVFGANEGPVSLNPKHFNDHSKTWYSYGTFTDVRDVFKGALPSAGSNKGYYHGLGAFKTYRCASVASSHATAALSLVKAQSGETYKIPNQDCLSQTVEVLATYGAPLSKNAYLANPLDWIPNNFYVSSYMSGFGPKHNV